MEIVISEELVAAVTPLIIALFVNLLQWLRSKDTNKHGDAFISILKSVANKFDNVAEILPGVKPYAEDYRDMVDEADKIWNSGGFTADDIKRIRDRAQIIEAQFNDAVAKYRALKEAVKTP